MQVTSLDGYVSEPLMSLDDYLSPPADKAKVSRRERMNLALSLSLAILQFYKTPWIDMWWTWKNFCVLKGDKSQIFVTKRFYSSHSSLSLKTKTVAHSPSTSAFWELVGEPVLTRLGFALVELALEKRLSELRKKSHCLAMTMIWWISGRPGVWWKRAQCSSNRVSHMMKLYGRACGIRFSWLMGCGR